MELYQFLILSELTLLIFSCDSLLKPSKCHSSSLPSRVLLQGKGGTFGPYLKEQPTSVTIFVAPHATIPFHLFFYMCLLKN